MLYNIMKERNIGKYSKIYVHIQTLCEISRLNSTGKDFDRGRI